MTRSPCRPVTASLCRVQISERTVASVPLTHHEIRVGVPLCCRPVKCAFCGYDGQLAGASVGVEAAHVRWFAFSGGMQGATSVLRDLGFEILNTGDRRQPRLPIYGRWRCSRRGRLRRCWSAEHARMR